MSAPTSGTATSARAGHPRRERDAPEVTGERGGHERGRDARDHEVLGRVPLAQHELDPRRDPPREQAGVARCASARSAERQMIATATTNARITTHASGRCS